MSSGDYGDVGVGGLATAGGIGFLARKHGLTIDHVVGAELVLADGSRPCRRRQHPDLLWAVRGAGGNFGIVTAFELEAYPVGDVVFSTMAFDARDAAAARALGRGGRGRAARAHELPHGLRQRGGARRPALLRLRRRRHRRRDRGADAAAGRRSAARPAGAARPVPRDRRAARRRAHAAAARAAFRAGLVDHITPDAARAVALALGARRCCRSARSAARSTTSTRSRPRTPTGPRTSRSTPSARRPRRGWDAEVAPAHERPLPQLRHRPRPERLHDAFPGETLERLRRPEGDLRPRQRLQPELPDHGRGVGGNRGISVLGARAGAWQDCRHATDPPSPGSRRRRRPVA